jgi:hypothetical protein
VKEEDMLRSDAAESATCIKTWNSLLSALMVNPCVFMVTLHIA